MTSKAYEWAERAEKAGRPALAELILDHDNNLDSVLHEYCGGAEEWATARKEAELLYVNAFEECT